MYATASIPRTLLSALLTASLLGAGVPTAAALAQSTQPGAPLVTGLPDFTNLVDKVAPAVVNIRTTGKRKPGNVEAEILRHFGMPSPGAQIQRGVGSGFIISADGFVLTNAHVVEGADEVLVTLSDRRELKAKVLGADERSDVALLKVDAANLPRLTVGDPGKIRVGEWVIAIGSPFNLDNTVTAGIISAKSRDTGDYLPHIQSDVAVNRGNSGGPLINMRGEAIGILSQIASTSGDYSGVSFAVPIDEVMRVADQLRTSGRVTRGRLGVEIGEVSKDVAESLGLGRARGAEVVRVEAASPAEKGGIKVGDIILNYNKQPIERSGDLPRLVGATAIGSKAVVTLWRRGRQQDLTVSIAALEDDKSPAKAAPRRPGPEEVNALGLRVSDLNEAQRKALGQDAGVVVESASGAAARTGLRRGDMILQVNQVEVKDAKQFNAIVAKLDPKRSVALHVRRGATTQFVVIKPN